MGKWGQMGWTSWTSWEMGTNGVFANEFSSGQMGSTPMGSLQLSCFVDRKYIWVLPSNLCTSVLDVLLSHLECSKRGPGVPLARVIWRIRFRKNKAKHVHKEQHPVLLWLRHVALGGHYLSNATCLIRPHVFSAVFLLLIFFVYVYLFLNLIYCYVFLFLKCILVYVLMYVIVSFVIRSLSSTAN